MSQLLITIKCIINSIKNNNCEKLLFFYYNVRLIVYHSFELYPNLDLNILQQYCLLESASLRLAPVIKPKIAI